MHLRHWLKTLIIFVIVGVLALGTLPPEQKDFLRAVPLIGARLADAKVNLGLDLQGGTHLDYRIVTTGVPASDVPAIIEGVREVIERRVNKLGVAEPNIYTSRVGDESHIVVELAGIKDIEEAKAIVGKTIQLEFSEQKTQQDPDELAQIIGKSQEFLAKAKADPAAFETVFEAYEQKPQIALEKDTEWQWVGDLSDEFKKVAVLPAGTVYPQTITPGQGEMYIDASGQVAQRQGAYVVRLLEKEEKAERTIEHKESRSVSHILIPFKGAERAAETVTRTEAEAQKLADDVLVKAKAPGADFAALAKEYSEDPGSKDKGGNYPTVERGQMVPAFEDAAFGLTAPGLVDHVVRSAFGYHIIRVEGITPATTEKKIDDRVKMAKAFFSTTPSGWQATGLTGQHFRRADVGSDPTTLRPVVNIYFTQAAVADKTVNWWSLVWWLAAIVAATLTVTYGLGLLVGDSGKKAVRRDIAIVVVSLIALAGAVYGINTTGKTATEDAPAAEATDGAVSETDQTGVGLFAEITKRNIGKPIAIFLDGEPIIDGNAGMPGRQDYAPTVQTEITSGQAVITGLSNYEEANELVQNLNTGAIPAPVKLSGQYTIGATLGEEALRTSLVAGAVGIALVMLFMTLYYRLPGFVSSIALAIYGVLLIAVVQAGGIVLTLAGIAGVVLSVGMAVDANVLIFERLKEELKSGKPLNTAIEDGFDRAWTSILASNVSSLITALILFWFGSSIIQGFALTLALGIVVSMFTAITVTRTMLRAISGRWAANLRYIFG